MSPGLKSIREIPGLPLFNPKEEVENTSMDRATDNNDRSMNRISSETTTPHEISHSTESSLQRRRPTRPRDVSWTAAAILCLPLGLILPHVYYSLSYVEHHNHCDLVECTVIHPSWAVAVSSSAMNSTIFFSSVVGAVLSVILIRFLYHTPGGGDGDDSRYMVITRTLLLASILGVMINPLLVLMIWHWLPKAKHVALLPMAFIMRDVWRARKTGSALPSFRGRGFGNTRGAIPMSTASSHDRKTFFRALACAVLDILSRSLRRKSFVRVASSLIAIQFLFVLLWWHALRIVLSVEIFVEDGIVTKFMHTFWMLAALLAGKWATGIVARLLTLIASGGVSSWFAQQNAIIVQLHAREQTMQNDAGEQQTQSLENSKATDKTYSSNKANAKAALHAMPEEYRSADAALYALPDFDDGVDDDYEDDAYDERGGRAQYNQIRGTNNSSSLSRLTHSHHTSTTVKAYLISGCTISFGSIAQCGLLGGLAQFLWSVCRNMDAMGFFIRRRFSNGTVGFRGMDIGSSGGTTWKQTISFMWRKLDVAIRGFVRGHSDLAMSHVSAYYKGYQRAANDVAVLIESSGVEPIIHDDITTHMCSCLCSVVSGSVVTFFGMLLITHRNATLSSKSSGMLPLEDISIFEILLFSYILCYTLLFTALEPLRAGIKALYVCFAEHPLSLSQAFPLIYQRLSRISESSVS